MKQHKIGIIGCGGIAHAHANAYLTQGERIVFTACCDLDAERAKSFAEEFGFERYYTDCYEMMEKEDLDCVSICTWNKSHAECAICAMRGGADVLSEKPMAMNAAEAQEMLEVSKETGKLLQVGFVRRFGKDCETMKRFIDEGCIGDVYYAKADYIRMDGWPGSWFGDKEYAGGGPLIDLGVHSIDLVRYLAGNPKPVSAFGVTYANIGPNRALNLKKDYMARETKQQFKFDVEDMASAMIRFDNGLTLHLETSYNLNKNEIEDRRSVTLFGTQGGATMEPELILNSRLAGMYTQHRPMGLPLGFDFSGSFANEIHHFLNTVEGKEECRATMEDGLWLMKILDAIYESARTGRSVDIV